MSHLNYVQVALNEQFMLAALPPRSSSLSPGESPDDFKHPAPEQHNRVLRVLIRRLGSSKTFYENMIFMLNRAGKFDLGDVDNTVC